MSDTYSRQPVKTSIELQRQFPGLRVLPLTKYVAHLLKIDSHKALNGDGSCSLANMETSCFASEFCAEGNMPSMKLDSLIHSEFAFVAVIDEPCEQPNNTIFKFVGCVSANRMQSAIASMFPSQQELHTPNRWVISNLCVSVAHRNCGAGRLLLSTITNAIYKKYSTHPTVHIHLLVMHHKDNDDIETKTVLGNRVARLTQTYTALSFKLLGLATNGQYLLFQYNKPCS